MHHAGVVVAADLPPTKTCGHARRPAAWSHRLSISDRAAAYGVGADGAGAARPNRPLAREIGVFLYLGFLLGSFAGDDPPAPAAGGAVGLTPCAPRSGSPLERQRRDQPRGSGRRYMVIPRRRGPPPGAARGTRACSWAARRAAVAGLQRAGRRAGVRSFSRAT